MEPVKSAQAAMAQSTPAESPPSVGSHALTVPCMRTKDAEGGRFRFRKGLGSGTLQASHQITR